MIKKLAVLIVAVLLVTTTLRWINMSVRVMKTDKRGFRQFATNQSSKQRAGEHDRMRPKVKYKVKTVYPETRNFNYILNNKTICDTPDPVSLLYVVSSAPRNFRNRHSIRSTFANSTYFKKYTVRVIFFLGRTGNSFKDRVFAPENRLVNEHKKYGDIIQSDFMDTYQNLTLKVVNELHWVSKYCSNALAVAKIDDDAFVDTVAFLLNYLPLFAKNEEDIVCNFMRSRVMRTGKWKLSDDQMKGHIVYPWTFCSGFVVFFRGKITRNLLKAATISPFVWVDDMYFSGVLQSRVNNTRYHYVRTTWVGRKHFMSNTSNILFGILENQDREEVWNFTITAKHKGLEY